MEIKGQPKEILSQVVDVVMHLPQDKKYQIEIKESKEKRSLDANAYFHVLVSKLAQEMHMNAEDLKTKLVTDYTKGVYVRIPKEANISNFGIRYFKMIGEAKGTKQPCNDYLVYKPTHEMDTKEMSDLIEGTIQECEQVGIQTITPNERANMLSLWRTQK